MALSAPQAAELLRDELARHGVDADVHAGYGMALVSVWVELLVWTNGRWFRWGCDASSAGNGRRVYAFGPADDVATAARRILRRREELRQRRACSQHPEDRSA
ncbi:hypothetical protein HS048_07505 [Planomonospora sp. ID91781]|uniref:hypothetical protein n=1 Tax=Planomonospora sp. ID91781 TaxID=2738135 RepID=UPI0018C42CDE|nr:hypothetical protein [Planomonospora sp. ID91781]MBG0820578.1 hypothetical protein [Planomonospora sp. ID91781]